MRCSAWPEPEAWPISITIYNYICQAHLVALPTFPRYLGSTAGLGSLSVLILIIFDIEDSYLSDRGSSGIEGFSPIDPLAEASDSKDYFAWPMECERLFICAIL